MYTIRLVESPHVFAPGDMFRYNSGFIGMLIYCPEEKTMNPYMIIDIHGNVQARATSPGLCFNRLNHTGSPEYLGRMSLAKEMSKSTTCP